MKPLIVSLAVLLLTATGAAAELTIFAASSLREAFIEIGQLYEKQTGQPVRFNFAGSQILRTQIEFGAPADLYAAANPQIIKPLVDKKLVGPVHFFAGNSLLALLAKQQGPINRLADLEKPGLQLAIGNRHVPIGKYTRQLFTGLAGDPAYGDELVNGIRRNVRTEESSVKAIVTRVLLDEVDAGIVYRTDLTADLRAKTGHLELPAQHNPFVRYPTAIVRTSRREQAAQAFIDLLLSAAGQAILQDHGFLPPAPGGRQ